MKRLLLVALMVFVTLVGMVGFSRAVNAGDKYRAYYDPKEAVTEPPATVNAGTEYNWTAYYDPKEAVTEPPATVNAGLPAKPKMYYLTVTGFAGGDAITACDSGFHMASISEIQDPSNLQYATGSTTRSTTRSTTVYDSIVALVDSPPLTRSTTRRATVYDSIVALVDQPPFDQASDQFPDHTGWVRTEADSLTGLVNNCDVWRSSSDQQSGTTYAAWWQLTQTASCSQPEPVWCVEDPEPVMRSAICRGTIDQQGGDCI
jgi:hypothetical protein